MTVTVQTSFVSAVERALLEVLSARPGLHGVSITNGLPWDPALKDVIWLGDVEQDEVPAGQRTVPHSREETFTLALNISVIVVGAEDHQPAVDRAHELKAEVEDALRDDLTINGSIPNGWAQVSSGGCQKRGPNEEGTREAFIPVSIVCRARKRGV